MPASSATGRSCDAHGKHCATTKSTQARRCGAAEGHYIDGALLTQCHIDHNLPFQVFDADRSHGAMLRFYGDYAEPIALDDFSSADRLMEAAVESEREALVDLAAQTSAPLFRWIDDNDLLSMSAEEGIQVVLWHIIDDGADGIDLLARLFERYRNDARYVVVKNLGRGKDFSAFESSSVRCTADDLDASIIELPELHASTMRKVDHHNLSFWAAGNNRQAGLGRMERQRVKVWMRRAYEQFETVSDTLCISSGPPSAQ